MRRGGRCIRTDRVGTIVHILFAHPFGHDFSRQKIQQENHDEKGNQFLEKIGDIDFVDFFKHGGKDGIGFRPDFTK